MLLRAGFDEQVHDGLASQMESENIGSTDCKEFDIISADELADSD